MAKKQNQDGTHIGRPPKMGVWIVAFEHVVTEDINAIIFTDEELRIETNDRVSDEWKISDTTFTNWKTGKVKDEMYHHFLAVYKKALLSQKKNLFKQLRNDVDKWQKWAWIIERKFDDWNLRSKVEAKVSTEQPLFGD